jgi:hypothetical protein
MGRNDGADNVTFNHTLLAGDDRIIVVAFHGEDASNADMEVQSVTYNGVAMTFAASERATGITTNRIEMWYILEADLPVSTGTYNIVVSTAGTVTSNAATAVQFCNMAQTAPDDIEVMSVSAGTTSTISVTPVNPNSMIIDGAVSANQSADFYVTGTDQNERVKVLSASHWGAMSSRFVSDNTSKSVSWEMSNATFNRIAHIALIWSPIAATQSSSSSTEMFSSSSDSTMSSSNSSSQSGTSSSTSSSSSSLEFSSFTSSSSSSVQQVDILWDNLIRAHVISGTNTLLATELPGQMGAESNQILSSGSGYIEFTVTSLTQIVGIGFSALASESDPSFNAMDFGIFQINDGLHCREFAASVLFTPTALSINDVLRVEYYEYGNRVEYKQNGTTVFTSTKAPVYPVKMDATMLAVGNTIENVKLHGGWV